MSATTITTSNTVYNTTTTMAADISLQQMKKFYILSSKNIIYVCLLVVYMAINKESINEGENILKSSFSSYDTGSKSTKGRLL